MNRIRLNYATKPSIMRDLPPLSPSFARYIAEQDANDPPVWTNPEDQPNPEDLDPALLPADDPNAV
jgi:hypothetical protein